MTQSARVTRSQGRQTHSGQGGHAGNDPLPSTQVSIPAALLESSEVKQFCSFIAANRNHHSSADAVAQCNSCTARTGELAYRLSSLEKGQERLEEQFRELNTKLDQAIQDIDSRLRVIAEPVHNAGSYVLGNGVQSMHSIPLPIGYHLSPDRPTRPHSENVARQTTSPGYFATSGPWQKPR